MNGDWWNDIKVNWVFLKYGAPHIRVDKQLELLAAHLVAEAGASEGPVPNPGATR